MSLLPDEKLAEQEAVRGEVLDQEVSGVPATTKGPSAPVPGPAVVARESMQLVNELRTVVVSATRPAHWLCWGEGRVVPDGPECLRLRAVLGIRFEITQPPTRHDYKDEDGQYFEATCLGRAAFVRKDGSEAFSVPAFGVASNRHPFFAKAHGKWKDPKEINSANIMRMAWTECLKDGVRGLLALVLDRNELEGITGKAPGKDPGGDIAARGPKDHAAEDTEELKKKRTAIFKTIVLLSGKDAALAKAFLVDLTTFTATGGERVKGKESVAHLTAKQVERLYDKRDTELSAARYADFLDRWNASHA